MQDSGYVYGIVYVINIKVSGVGEGIKVSQAYLLVTDRKGSGIGSDFSKCGCHVLVKPFSQSDLLFVVPLASLPYIIFRQLQHHNVKLLHRLLFPSLQ